MFVRAQRRPQFESDRCYLDVYDRATGTKRTLFESPDLSVERLQGRADGSAVCFIATNHGEDNLFRLPLDSGGAPVAARGRAARIARRPSLGPDFAVF